MFEHLPSKEKRNFNISSLIGKSIDIELRELSQDLKDQWVVANIEDCTLSGWVKSIGTPNTKVKRKIIDVYIMEKSNGGSSDLNHYKSYNEYFNEEKKVEVLDFWKRDVFSSLFSGIKGDVDEISLFVEFKDFKLDSNLYDYSAPEEWYSELFIDDNRFKFEKGFFENADEAILSFSNQAQDDLFGTRYFPVVVFPKDTNADVRNIVDSAKSCSKPIVIDQYIIFGTRCKSYEYRNLIIDTYKNGGFIAKEIQWDWE